MDKYLGLTFLFVWVAFFFFVIFKYGDDKTSPGLTLPKSKRRRGK